VRGKKNARQTGHQSGFVFLLVNPEFYSHLASWRVVIRTPDVGFCNTTFLTILHQVAINGHEAVGECFELFNDVKVTGAEAAVLATAGLGRLLLAKREARLLAGVAVRLHVFLQRVQL
jgi:hypothetical protein